MSIINPGKRGILTVIALMLIVGVPGVIAYADSSDDTYYSAISVTAPEYVNVYGIGSEYNYGLFGVTSVGSDGVYDVYVDSSSASSTPFDYDTFTSISAYHIILEDADIAPTQSHITFESDIPTSSVYVAFLRSNNSSLATYEMSYDEEFEIWTYDVSSVDVVSLDDAATLKFVVQVPSDSQSDILTEFHVAYSISVPETIFTDDVVELIVMVGGIALLICGTFALSFIDVDTPGKAVSYAKRGIRSAGNKMRRGKK